MRYKKPYVVDGYEISDYYRKDLEKEIFNRQTEVDDFSPRNSDELFCENEDASKN